MQDYVVVVVVSFSCLDFFYKGYSEIEINNQRRDHAVCIIFTSRDFNKRGMLLLMENLAQC